MTACRSPASALHAKGRLPAASGAREHGGRLDRAAARYGIARACWIDLSTGINPHGYPVPMLPADVWRRLPDSALDERLRAAAASCYRVHDARLVVPAPGSQALIQWLPRLEPPSRVTVLGPTYNEHAPAWVAAGHQVGEIGGLDAIPGDADVVVAVNPNNPDGRVAEPLRLLELTERRLVVVDEAFADTVPEASMARWVGRANLVVLRSIGKFFGLAGLRLGFALAERKRALALGAALGPWPVSGPAATIGIAALTDEFWIANTRARLTAAAARLDQLLAAGGLAVLGGTPLFRLIVHPDAEGLYERLARCGILTRRFAAQPDWLRLGLPADETEWARLAEALAGLQRDGPRQAGPDGDPPEQATRS